MCAFATDLKTRLETYEDFKQRFLRVSNRGSKHPNLLPATEIEQRDLQYQRNQDNRIEALYTLPPAYQAAYNDSGDDAHINDGNLTAIKNKTKKKKR